MFNFIKSKKFKLNSQNSRSENFRKNWIELSKKNFDFNISQIKKNSFCPNLFIVLKSNAYGHGLKEIGFFCDQNSYVSGVCVFSLSEALFLRSQGFKKNILVLSLVDAPIEFAIKNNITLTIFDVDQAQEINSVASKLKLKANVHIKIDTGLSRLGFLSQDKKTILNIKNIYNLKNIFIEGIFSHFAESDQEHDSFCLKQVENFRFVLQELKRENINIPLKHISSSSALIRYKDQFPEFNMARVGGAAYGIVKPKIKKLFYPELKMVLSWKCKPVQIKEVPKGSFVSYGRTYQLKRDSKLAILPIGYYDGYPHQLSNKGYFYANDQLFPVVGRIGMNMTIIDITDSKNFNLNTVFTGLGFQIEINPGDISLKTGKLIYEVVAGINQSIEKMVV